MEAEDGPTGCTVTTRSFVFAVAIGAFALLLRLHGLGDKPFWLDEVASLASCDGAVAVPCRRFAAQWPLSQLFSAALACREDRNLAMAAEAPLSHVRRNSCVVDLRDRRQGFRPARWYHCWPAHGALAISGAVRARGAIVHLVSCLILTALYGLVRLSQQPAAAALPLNKRGALGSAWSAYGLGTAAALNVLNVAIPWFIAANLSAPAIARAASDANRGFWRNWIAVQLLILAAWAPMLALIFLRHSGNRSRRRRLGPGRDQQNHLVNDRTGLPAPHIELCHL